MKSIYITLITAILLTSCVVSKKKYDELLAQKIRSEADLNDKTLSLNQAESTIQELESTLESLKNDTTSLGSNLRASNKKLSDLEKEFDQLNGYYKNLLTSSGKLNRDMAQQQEQLLAIQENLERTRKVNDSLSSNLAEREKKVKELELILANKDKAVEELRNKISNALLNFKENDITVKVKNGKVYVSLAEQLLFGSGSIEVDSKGVSALQQLAKAIKDQKDLNILVEGHTDNVPISKKSTYMQDNWDLSVMRATSITKILTNAGLSPRQITAAGRGEHIPLATNDTAANKQKNRRTEIIITPNLDELFKILGNN
jgi:chemotaxis protein MotB